MNRGFHTANLVVASTEVADTNRVRSVETIMNVNTPEYIKGTS